MAHCDESIAQLLEAIYGRRQGRAAVTRLEAVMAAYRQSTVAAPAPPFSQDDVVLITYADSLMAPDAPALRTFARFSRSHFKGVFSHIHFLPFYPFSSDDGFSVTDYYAIRADLGGWADVAAVGRHFKLMFDYVLNHVSAQSDWFRRYLAGAEGFEDLAIAVDPDTDLSAVVRPRALPLLTPFVKDNGDRVWLWTTFSADQIDLNFRSLDTLARMIDVLLFYTANGASMVRMDAVGYLWKEIGSSCIHLRQTHLAVKLMRRILTAVSPRTLIVTETNVPHSENVSYFGDGGDEAHMVYNFTLPPLLLHTFLTKDASDLSRWAECLRTPSGQTTFFNFSASHDGIGVRPLEGILPAEAVARLVDHVRQNGGMVSTKRNTDGSESPYELNITYIDALRRTGAGKDALHAERFLAAQSIPLVLPGVPAVYIHSILGSRNWSAGVARTGHARSINRERLDVRHVLEDLARSDSFRSRIYRSYCRMIRLRRQLKALHPNADFTIHHLDPRVFAIQRQHGAASLTALINVTDAAVAVRIPDDALPLTDVVSGAGCSGAALVLGPYQAAWLVPPSDAAAIR